MVATRITSRHPLTTVKDCTRCCVVPFSSHPEPDTQWSVKQTSKRGSYRGTLSFLKLSLSFLHFPDLRILQVMDRSTSAESTESPSDHGFLTEHLEQHATFARQQIKAIARGREREAAAFHLTHTSRLQHIELLAEAGASWSTQLKDTVARAACMEDTILRDRQRHAEKLDDDLRNALRICQALKDSCLSNCETLVEDPSRHDPDVGESRDHALPSDHIDNFLIKCGLPAQWDRGPARPKSRRHHQRRDSLWSDRSPSRHRRCRRDSSPPSRTELSCIFQYLLEVKTREVFSPTPFVAPDTFSSHISRIDWPTFIPGFDAPNSTSDIEASYQSLTSFVPTKKTPGQVFGAAQVRRADIVSNSRPSSMLFWTNTQRESRRSWPS